jgi:6-pyruvoyltetrahydropterin/6-carboxytetrahydropterin synthase
MPHVTLSRIYRFSAAHRLHSAALDEHQNQQVFDKCNNPYGHGHDYTLEVTVAGTPDPQTGMIIPLPRLDKIVNDFLMLLEHKHLDREVPYFKDKTSTGENIVQFLWRELDSRLPADMLYHIRLWETNNNYFDMGKE